MSTALQLPQPNASCTIIVFEDSLQGGVEAVSMQTVLQAAGSWQLYCYETLVVWRASHVISAATAYVVQ